MRFRSALHDAACYLLVVDDTPAGEFTAACAAGAFSFEDGVKIVKARGSAMAAAAAESEGGMVAVTAAAAGHQVLKTEFGGKLVPANVLAEGVVVYAGRVSDCNRLLAFCDEFMKRGQVRARASRVAVAGAFHTPMMQVCSRCSPLLATSTPCLMLSTFALRVCIFKSAKTAFDPVLNTILDLPPNSTGTDLLPLHAPLVSSDGTTLRCKRAVAQSLSRQMTSPVRFDLICARMAAIAAEVADAQCKVDVVEFSPRASLGPLLLRAWKENQIRRRPQQQQQQELEEDIGKMRVAHFCG